MPNDNGFIDNLKLGRGCGYGHENRILMEGMGAQFDDLKEYFSEQRKKLDWMIYLIIALSFMVGGEIITKLIPMIIHR